MKSIEDKQILSILVNEDFINYVLNPNLILIEKWESYLNENPHDVKLIQEAKRILLGEINPVLLGVDESSRMKMNILSKCGISAL